MIERTARPTRKGMVDLAQTESQYTLPYLQYTLPHL